MVRQRIDRKELKRPDQFIARSVVILEWAKNHMTHILYGVVGVAVIVGLIMGWSSWQRQRVQKAAEALHHALKLSATSAENTGEANTAQAIERLQAITRDYSQTPAATDAHWHLGHLYFTRGDVKAALEAYEQARRRLPRGQQLRTVLATLNVGYAQEAMNACDQAIGSYEAVQQSPVYWLHGEAYLGMGRCYERSGATDKAIGVYDQALADGHVIGQTQQTISERLARLQPAVEPPTAQDKAPETAPSTAEKNPAEDSAAASQATQTAPSKGIPPASSATESSSEQASPDPSAAGKAASSTTPKVD